MSTLTLHRKKYRTARDSYYPGDYAHTESTEERARAHTNLLWLCEEMEKLSEDVNDREICRRMRQFAGQIEYDLPAEVVLQLRSRRDEIEVGLIPEALVPFYRHFQFMRKRKMRARII